MPYAMEPVIEVEHLAHRYGRRAIYTDLNFTIPPGKVCGLLGTNAFGWLSLIGLAGSLAGFTEVHRLRRGRLPSAAGCGLVAAAGLFGCIALGFLGSDT